MHQSFTAAALGLVPWIILLGVTVIVLRFLDRHLDQRRQAARREWAARSAEADRALADYLSSVLQRPASVPACLRELGLGLPTNVPQIQQAYRALAKACHPDVGGAHERMQHLNHTRDQALRWLAEHPFHATATA